MIDPSYSALGSAALDQRPSRKEILVIEDDPDHRDAVRETLEEEGYRVKTAVDGADALVRLMVGPPPDLILLDLRMPVMDGWAFMAALRRRAGICAIPVVATTASGVAALFSTRACAGHIPKPFGRIQLIATIERCMSRPR